MSNNKSTCYAIIGTPRSGSSVLSGVVHNLGIHVGDNLLPACQHNEKGFFEDIEFLNIHQNMYGTIPNLFGDARYKDHNVLKPAYTNLIRKRCTRDKWGVKDPRMVLVLEYFHSCLENCNLKILSTQRPINQSAKSMEKVINTNYRKASEIIGRYEVARLDALLWAKNNNIEHIIVPYEELMTSTKETVNKIASFCEVDDEESLIMANMIVDKGLWHNKS